MNVAGFARALVRARLALLALGAMLAFAPAAAQDTGGTPPPVQVERTAPQGPRVLSNQDLWGADLTQLPGFADAVTDFLIAIVENGAAATLRRFVAAEEHAQA